MRKLASIVRIASCDPIPETDRLSVARMDGLSWNVVTGRNEFKSGDIAVYFEIDAALDPQDSRYAFLKDRCLRKFVTKSGTVLKEVVRIKTCKLRGVISQGLLMPISLFPEVSSVEVGTDVTNVLNVLHYDELKDALAPECGFPSIPSDARMGDFPTYLCPKSDEDRIQIHADYFTTMKGRIFEVSEKRDGSSTTFIYSPRLEGEPFAVCSRNMRLKRTTDKGVIPQPWKTCATCDAERKITDYCVANNRELAFQGELQGAGINSNRDLLTEFTWQVFKVYDCVNQQYLLPDEARSLCESIGLEYVPVISKTMDVFNLFNDADALLKFAEGKTSRGNEREGLVFKSCDYPYISFKAVSNRYLCKEND